MTRLGVTSLTWPGLALATMLWAALLLFRDQPLAPWWPALVFLVAPLCRRQALMWLLIGMLGCWMAWTYQHSWAQRLMVPAQDMTLRGTIVDQPEHADGNAYFAFKPDAEAMGLLRTSWYRNAPELKPGDCWNLQLRVRPPHGNANPGGFDYESWLFRETYVGKASVRGGELCGKAGDDWRARWAEALQRFERPRASATLRALLLGDRRDIGDEDWAVLRRTGTTHLFAISGLHLGLIAALGWALGIALWKLIGLRWWPRASDWGAIGAVLLAGSYAWVSGFGLPVQRALIMCVFGVLALLAGRQRQAGHVLALAFVLVVALNPLSVLMPGLWLSFVAAGGIIAYLHVHAGQSWLKQLLGIQVLLAFLLLPLSVLLFGGVSMLGASVNLLLVPLFSVLLPFLLFSSLLHLGLDWEQPLGWALQLLDVMWAGLESVSQWPLAYWEIAQPTLWVVVLATLGVLLWTQRAWGWRALGGLLVMPLVLIGPERPEIGELRAWVWDVGQGQSVLLQTANHDLLYDTGPAWGRFSAADRLILPALQALGIRRLDGLMISHPDSDHAGGAEVIQQHLKPHKQWGVEHAPCRAGQSWRWDDVDFEVVHPGDGAGSDNDRSCVLRVRNVHGRTMLLPGDIEALGEATLLAAYPSLRADVLLMPHHGSKSSSTQAFVERLEPRVALASAGWNNRWGFPSSSVRQRYLNAGADVHVSGDEGALRVELGETIEVRGWRNLQPRLWRDFSSDGEP